MSTETPTNPFESFEPFAPGALPAADPPAAKRGRKPRNPPAARKKPRASGAQSAPPKAAAPKAARKSRKPREAKAPRAASIDLQTAVAALVGLKPDDAHLLGRMVSALQNVPKKSRARIVAALGKVFA